ncbi:MAG TPA: hypothetical protein VK617_10225, partial [Gemmatimonadaceae bacterium]|nr:hypothetical protein [Gemmatimonadaceae bacterium]
MNKFWFSSALILVAACAKGKTDAAPADTATAAAAAPLAVGADTGMQMGGTKTDADKPIAGTGVPAGYRGVTDHADSKITDAKYTVNGERWEIQTGPAHITFAA